MRVNSGLVQAEHPAAWHHGITGADALKPSTSPSQAEELNTIVGTAFRVAYALQIEREKPVGRFGEPQQIISLRSNEDLLRLSDKTPCRSLSSTTSAMCLVQTDEACRKNARVMDRLNLIVHYW